MNFNIVSILIVSMFLSINVNGQNENNETTFIDFFVSTGTSFGSNYLSQSRFASLISNPNSELEGFRSSNTGLNFGIGVAVDQQIGKNISAIANFKYHNREEDVICFCHSCDKIATPQKITNVKSLALGFGVRTHVSELRNINIKLDATTNFGLTLGRDLLKYLSFNLSPVIEVKLDSGNKFQIKMGVEKSFLDYRRTDLFLETGFSFKLKKNQRDNTGAK